MRPSPLMLMVLALLAEAPMHPYEMQRLMHWRGKTQVVRVQRGSLYPAVERLVKAGLVELAETEREGRRPERTVYRITDEGRETAETWLMDMLGTVRNEYPEFPAALSFLALISSEIALAQLTSRELALRRGGRRPAIPGRRATRALPAAAPVLHRGRISPRSARGRVALGDGRRG